jgi:hypothetical protein
MLRFTFFRIDTDLRKVCSFLAESGSGKIELTRLGRFISSMLCPKTIYPEKMEDYTAVKIIMNIQETIGRIFIPKWVFLSLRPRLQYFSWYNI